ncbi:MAG: nitrilase-related carbon-nitrogen hydrolase [Acidimicrobiales bacterium]
MTAPPHGETIRLRVGAIQLAQVARQKEANLEEAMRELASLVDAGADLVVLPELFASGYLFADRDDVMPYAEESQGQTFERITTVLNSSETIVVYGYVEHDPATDRLHNAAAVVRRGELLARYRKIHPFLADTTWAADGNEPPPRFAVGKLTATVAICADIEFPELFVNGSPRPFDLLCLPTAWVDERAPSATWWLRARDFGVPIVAADLSGKEQGTQFSGGTCIIDDTGRVLIHRDEGTGSILWDLEVPLRADRVDTHAAPRPSLATSTWSFSPSELSSRAGSPLSPLPSGRIGLLAVADESDVLPESLTSMRFEHVVVALPDSEALSEDSSRGQRWLKTLSEIDAGRVAFVSWNPRLRQVTVGAREEHHAFLITTYPLEIATLQLAEGGLTLALVPASQVEKDPRTLLEASVQGAHVAIVVGGITTAPVPRIPSKLALPPEVGTTSDTFDILRVRAGEAAVVVLHSGHPREQAHPGGVYGPDHITQPLAESLLGEERSHALITIEDDPNDPVRVALTQRSYLGRRKPWLY